MTNRWESIEAFVRVAELGNFSKAASAMNTSKSYISRHIAQLEARLDAQLLIRTTRKVSLTEVGQAFYLRCRDLVGGLEEAEQAVIDLQETPRGLLRISVSGAFGEDYVAPLAVSFMQQHPQLAIELDFNNRLVNLIDEGYDLAIRSGTLKDSSLIARRIGDRELLICASPEYFMQQGKPAQLKHLEQHNCLSGSLPTWTLRDGQRHFDYKTQGNWKSNNGRALLQAAIGGLGLVQLPEFYVRTALQQGLLQTALDNHKPTNTGVWAVYPHNRHLSAKVRLFVNYLADHFAN